VPGDTIAPAVENVEAQIGSAVADNNRAGALLLFKTIDERRPAQGVHFALFFTPFLQRRSRAQHPDEQYTQHTQPGALFHAHVLRDLSMLFRLRGPLWREAGISSRELILAKVIPHASGVGIEWDN